MTPPGNIVSFPELKGEFAAASKAWLNVWTDSRVTHGEARLAMRLFLYIDWKHFQATGQLLSYPSWKRLQEETTLTKRSVARNLKKFDSVGAIKTIHGGRDPKTGQRRPNQYLLIPPNQNRNETAQVAWMTPSQVTPESPGQVTQPGDSSDIRPGDSRAPISGEVRVSGEYINIGSPGDSNVTSQVTDEKRGCPRVGGPRVLPTATPSLNGNSHAAMGVVPRGGDVVIRYESAAARLWGRFCAAHSREFPRSSKWPNFQVRESEWAAALDWASAAKGGA